MQRVTAEADVRLEDDIDPIRWQDDHLLLLDQTRLPGEQVWVHIHDAHDAAESIKQMRVRGAPALHFPERFGVIDLRPPCSHPI